MDNQKNIQAGEISEEKLRAVFRGVLEQFITDVVEGRVEVDAVLANWLRDQSRLQNRVGEESEKSRNEPQSS